MERLGGPQSVDSDFEDLRHDYRNLPDVALSLCGAVNDLPEPPEDLFLKFLVTYEDFVGNPRLIENPDLDPVLFRFHHEDLDVSAVPGTRIYCQSQRCASVIHRHAKLQNGNIHFYFCGHFHSTDVLPHK